MEVVVRGGVVACSCELRYEMPSDVVEEIKWRKKDKV